MPTRKRAGSKHENAAVSLEKEERKAEEDIEMRDMKTSQPHAIDFTSILKNKKKISTILNDKISILRRKQSSTPSTPYVVNFPSVKLGQNPNYISTTKYTILTFIPLNLYFQFRRFYNFYFLLGALCVFTGFSSLSATSQIMPLAVVLAFSAVKEIVEDVSRYRADRVANNTSTVKIENGHKANVPAMSLQHGDIVYVSKGSKFFVDVILLSSSYDDGTAFIETADLDGETNLKRKSTLAPSQSSNTDELISKLYGKVECEHPNENLLSFEGRCTMKDAETPCPVSMLHFVPRGSVLRNTDFIYGVVIYTGSETKIMKNLKQGKLKSSSLEARLNTLVSYAFLYNAILLFVSIFLEYMYYTNIKSMENISTDTFGYNWYLGFQASDVSYHLWGTSVSFFILYTYVIPISLFVTIELSRLGQATYMVLDPKMVYSRLNSDKTITKIPMKVNNSNLNEDLGCIDYIFSDKTGTLTQNSMNMSNFWCDGYVMDEMKEPGIVFKTMKNSSVSHDTIQKMDLFMMALALCHGVIPSWDETLKEMIYESQSPDETALLTAARSNNYSLLKRTKQAMEVDVNGKLVKVDILGVVEFNSTRKRMSVVVRMDENGESKIIVFCKGADNIMMARMDKTRNDTGLLSKAADALIDFSNIGLRTLVIGYRELSESEFAHFQKNWDDAEISLSANRDDLLGAASELIETNMLLLGCTAIEDKLQDKVPETIENLLLSGIKMWLLTGDKQETAINIGLSSRLIDKKMRVCILASKSVQEAESDMNALIEEQAKAPPSQVFALVVDGQVLSMVFAGAEQSKEKFLKIGKRCKTVICARVTPLQKALVVRLVRRSLKKSITLAIGDGANDVSMIQEAHVGVGIMGKEGAQAVRAADYAFGEFRFLQRLLNVHGRFNYLRMANLILYSFYKNFTFITIQFYFGFVNSWSGQIVNEEIFFTSYNVIFTFLPPFAYALYARDLPEKLLEENPEFYREVKKGLFWNNRIIMRWLILAVMHSILIFGIVYFLNYEGTLDVQGRSTGYWVQCYLLSTPLLITVTLKQITITKFWFWIPVAAVLLSFALNTALMFGLVLLSSFTYSDYETAVIIHVLPSYYILMFLIPAVCNLPDLFADYVISRIWPSDTDIAQEYTVMNKLKI